MQVSRVQVVRKRVGGVVVAWSGGNPGTAVVRAHRGSQKGSVTVSDAQRAYKRVTIGGNSEGVIGRRLC